MYLCHLCKCASDTYTNKGHSTGNTTTSYNAQPVLRTTTTGGTTTTADTTTSAATDNDIHNVVDKSSKLRDQVTYHSLLQHFFRVTFAFILVWYRLCFY